MRGFVPLARRHCSKDIDFRLPPPVWRPLRLVARRYALRGRGQARPSALQASAPPI